jgi:sugar lactone lactonase YvrE
MDARAPFPAQPSPEAMMTPSIFDTTPCTLGEGPLWHPERRQLFWFDILEKRLLTRQGDETRYWQFDGCVSAAGWIDPTRLLIASETGLATFDLDTGATEQVAAIEADIPHTRSNDGRADPQGGFWIGTMGKGLERGAGAIYRYYRGELRRLFDDITVPNAICFAPDGRAGYFADTMQRRIWRQGLDTQGWPEGAPEVFVDMKTEALSPDGAVVDADGVLWNAQWGAGRVAAYGPDGRFLHAIAFDAEKTTCPAFGGPDLGTLFCTSACEGMSADERAAHPGAGATFAVQVGARGQAEHRVIL